MADPTQPVRAFYAAVAAGDVTGILALLHPHLAWTEAEGFPYYSGTWTAPQQVVDRLLVPLMRDWNDFSAVADDFIVDGDRVVSLGAYGGTSKATGRAMRAPFAHVWQIADGKLQRFDMYTDTLLIDRALRLDRVVEPGEVLMIPSSDIAFTPTVKAIQAARGSRAAYAKMEARGGFRTAIDASLTAFLAEVDTAYVATATADGQPYAQHRGGPKGFIRVVGEGTLGFIDYTGNRQYVTTGNLADNDRAFLFLMDYAHRRRIKLWGRARVVAADEALTAALMPEDYGARPEQVILFDVEAWDVNCPQHIPQKFDAADVAAAVTRLETRIADLEADNARLRAAGSQA